MVRLLLPRCFLTLGFLALASCASYVQETKQIRDLYQQDHYAEALEKLESTSLATESKNALLFRMEKAMILDRMGRHRETRATLTEADKIADELYTTSVSRTAATFVMNEGVANYEGEDYEKVAIHTILALSYLGTGELREARVEAAKINNKLAEITQKYDKPAAYREDAFARLLSGMIYEALGEWDSAIVDYRKALAIFSGAEYKRFYRGDIPDALIAGLYRCAKKKDRRDVLGQLSESYGSEVAKLESAFAQAGGDVIVIHEVGRIATKHAKEFIFPFGGQVVRFSFPFIDPPRYSVGNSSVTFNNTAYAASNAADMDAIAHFALEDRRGRMLAKSAARLLLKGQMVRKAGEELGLLGGLAANVFTAVTETADTRSWTLLPRAFSVTRVRLPVGKQAIQISTGGRISDFRDVDVKDGAVTLIRDVEH